MAWLGWALLLVTVVWTSLALRRQAREMERMHAQIRLAQGLTVELIADERRRQQDAEREFLDWLTDGRSG